MLTDPGSDAVGREPGPLPGLLRYLSWGVLAVCVAMTFAGGWSGGVTEDEPFHVQRFDHFLQTGWYLGDGQMDHGRPAAGMTQQYVYGPAAMLVLHAVNALVGVEPWGRAGTSADAYGVRHLSVGFFGLLGVLAVVLAGRVLFRRWDWGVFAGAVMVAVPLWTGHAMFNLKDVPVATGYAWATLGLLVLAREHEAARWWVRWGGPVALVAGTVLSVGTRPAIWSGIAFGAVVLLVGRGMRREPAALMARVRADVWVLRDLVVATLASWLLLWWMDPKVFGAPATVLIKSVHSSATFYGIATPGAVVPIWVAMQIPLLVGGFALVGTTVVLRRTIAAKFRPAAAETRWLVVGAQAFAMPVGVIVTQSPVYGDLRQLLFALPASTLLATLGIHRLLVGAGSVRDPHVATMARWSVAVGLTVPVVMQGLLFPYNYVYYNPLAALAHLNTNGDFYHASGRALAGEVPLDGRMVCQPEGDEGGRATREAHLDGWTDCRTDMTSPVAPYQRDFSGSTVALGPEEFWAMTFQPGLQPAPNCQPVTHVSRRTLWQHLSMATLARCTLPFPTLPDRTVEFRETDPVAVRLPDLGWLLPSVDQSGYGIRARGPVSTVVFRLPESARGKPATLTIRTAESASPVTTFGGVLLPITALSSGTGFTVTIPRDLVDRAIGEPQTLEFRSGASGGLVMKVLSIQLATG
jgi:hypothetical protein